MAGTVSQFCQSASLFCPPVNPFPALAAGTRTNLGPCLTLALALQGFFRRRGEGGGEGVPSRLDEEGDL